MSVSSSFLTDSNEASCFFLCSSVLSLAAAEKEVSVILFLQSSHNLNTYLAVSGPNIFGAEFLNSFSILAALTGPVPFNRYMIVFAKLNALNAEGFLNIPELPRYLISG